MSIDIRKREGSVTQCVGTTDERSKQCTKSIDNCSAWVKEIGELEKKRENDDGMRKKVQGPSKLAFCHKIRPTTDEKFRIFSEHQSVD